MDDGRLCFHRCLSVVTCGGVGVPPSFLLIGWGLPPSFLTRWVPHPSQQGVPSSQVWTGGYRLPKSGWGYPLPGRWVSPSRPGEGTPLPRSGLKTRVGGGEVTPTGTCYAAGSMPLVFQLLYKRESHTFLHGFCWASEKPSCKKATVYFVFVIFLSFEHSFCACNILDKKRFFR